MEDSSFSVLRVGDPHVKVNNIKEAEKLMDFVLVQAVKNKVDQIDILGDLFHTHAVIRMEVLNFWDKWFGKVEDINTHNISKGVEQRITVNAMVGNHDMSGSREKEQIMNALNVFKRAPYVFIIDRPIFGRSGIAYAPYISDHEWLIKELNQMVQLQPENNKCLIAHQTFTGAKYENGFYAPDGIEQDLIPFEQIISGHIHASQQVGKCFYPGTPKWDNLSDANQEKGIWIFEHNSDGSIVSERMISTKDVVTCINKWVVHEGDTDLPDVEYKGKHYIEFHGKSAWIAKMKKIYKGKANIKAKPSDRRSKNITKEDNINLDKYLEDHFVPVDGVTREDIIAYLREKEVV